MKTKVLNIFSSALIVLSAFFFICGSSLLAEEEFVTQSVTVTALSGKVEVFLKGSFYWRKAQAGMQLTEGDKIRTAEDTKAELVFKDGSFIRMKEKTTLGVKTARQELSTQASQYNLDFRVGEIMVELKKLKKGSSFKVETPTAVAAARGTTYYMRTGTKVVDGVEKSFVEIYIDSDDTILFTNTVSGESYIVTQGQGSIVYDDGTMEEPYTIPPEDRDAWKSGFDIVYDDDAGKDVDDTTGSQDDAQEDADKDQTDEQDISGLAKVDIITIITDSDDDGLTDLDELAGNTPYNYITDPTKADTDDDGVADGPTSPPDRFPLDFYEQEDTDDDVPDYWQLTAQGDKDSNLFMPGQLYPGDNEDAFPRDNTIDPDLNFNNIDGELVTVRGYGSRYELRQATIDNLLEDIQDMLGDIQDREFEARKEEIFDHQAGKVMTDRWGNRVRVEEYVSKPTSNQVQILALNLRTGGPNAGISSLDFRVKFDKSITGSLQVLPWDDYMYNPLVNDVPGIPAAEGRPYAQLILYDTNPNGNPIPDFFSLEVKNPFAESVKVTETYDTPAYSQSQNIWYQVQNRNEIDIEGAQGPPYNYYTEDFTGAGGSWDIEKDWGEGWNRENRFTFLDYYGEGAWLMGVFYLIDDNGNSVPVEDVDDYYLRTEYINDQPEEILNIRGIRDCVDPPYDYNLEMVFLSSKFGNTLFGLPSTIADEMDSRKTEEARESYLFNLYDESRTIDLITIGDISEHYEFKPLSPAETIVPTSSLEE